MHNVFLRFNRLIYLCGKSTDLLYDTDDKRKAGSAEEGVFDRICMNKFGGVSAKLKHALFCWGLHKISENRIFTDADDYSIEIEQPLAECPQNLDIYANDKMMAKELKELAIL